MYVSVLASAVRNVVCSGRFVRFAFDSHFIGNGSSGPESVWIIKHAFVSLKAVINAQVIDNFCIVYIRTGFLLIRLYKLRLYFARYDVPLNHSVYAKRFRSFVPLYKSKRVDDAHQPAENCPKEMYVLQNGHRRDSYR